MRLLTIQGEKGYDLGIKLDESVLNITECLTAFPAEKVPDTMDALIAGGEDALAEIDAYVNSLDEEAKKPYLKKEEEITFGPCVPHPGKIVGIGLNYQAVLEDSNGEKPVFPRLFTKFSEAVVGHKGTVLAPFNSNEMDYEAELCIIIGKKARLVSEEEALDYVLGYCNANDLSARDFQYFTPSWVPGKCCDTFAPIGPYIVTKDEVPDPNDLSLKCWVNGKLRQNHTTSDMIFNCKALISGVSRFFTLQPGDIIFTGTSGGIILNDPVEERVWLKEGDVMEVEMGNLGKLVNYVKKEVIE